MVKVAASKFIKYFVRHFCLARLTRGVQFAGQRYTTETFASREIVIFVMPLKIVKNAAQQRQQQHKKQQQAEGAAAAAAAAEKGAVTRRAGSALE